MAEKIEGCSKNILPYFWAFIFVAFVVFYWAYYIMSNRSEDNYDLYQTRQEALQQNRQDIQRGDKMGMVVGGGNPSHFSKIIPKIREVVVNISVMNPPPALQGRVANQTPALNDKQIPGGLTFVDPFTGPEFDSIGSGIIIEASGYILTNYHVVERAKTVFVTTFTDEAQQRYQAQVIKTDPLHDLALVQINPRKELAVAILGDSNEVNIGDVVIAVGSPWGLSQSVTSGIVSAKRQSLTIEGVTHANLLQTDAAINQGNSGGPLINADGEVIGINTAIYTTSGAFSGVGFAVPSNQAKEFIEDTIGIELPIGRLANNLAQQVLFGFGVAPPILMGVAAPHPYWGECTNCHVYINSPTKQGTSQAAASGLNIAAQTNLPGGFSNMDKPYVGLDIQKIDNIIARQFNIDSNKGVMINFIAENSPAMKAGLQIGDVIIKLNGRWVATPFTFDSILNKEPVGETVRIAFLRNGQRSEANLTTEAMPRNLNNISPWNGPLFRAPEEMEWMGLEVSLLTAKIARKRQLPIDEKGLYVIEADGIAGASGIVPGDIIKSINRMPITDFNSYNEAIKRVNLNDGIVLQVSRMGRHSFVALQ
ncbi:MAG TPA: PDZ domain-containing protein [Candidatus Scalindua sp.]|nr:PDZ domain-containing protein [Candidatus Scalindua sp.]